MLVQKYLPLLMLGAAQAQNSSLPVVDLGYELHRAAYLDSNDNYAFTNIRFAQPPLGNLRFRAPEPPTTNRSAIQDGHETRLCPQAAPAWVIQQQSGFSSRATSSSKTTEGQEDCLFLDINVPAKVFNNVINTTGTPVLVWFFGGGFVAGHKSDGSDPSALLARAQKTWGEGFVHVAINYRTGAFGWLAGSSLQQDGKGTANAGLYDQVLGLEWIKNYIHLFGGDRDKVTVMGGSAGGGSIVHHLTAHAGLSSSLFSRAILESAAWLPEPSPEQQEETYTTLLATANVSSLSDLRNLSSEELMAANRAVVSISPYGQFTFGPVVDGNYVTANPRVLLNRGLYNRNVSVMMGHTADEGLYFTPTNITTDAAFVSFLQSLLPQANIATISYLSTNLYPPPTDKVNSTNLDRTRLLMTDALALCNFRTLGRVNPNKTFGYNFAISPGYHGQDAASIFYGLGNVTVAATLQDWITSFVIKGRPFTREEGVPDMVPYGEQAEVVKVDSSIIKVVSDVGKNKRCDWWGLGLEL